MSEKTREVSYLVCDGCGYAIGSKDDHMILTIKRTREEAKDRHFHYPQQEGENRPWGASDCLGYWYLNSAAREMCMAKHKGDAALAQALHVGAMKERYPPKGTP